MGAWLLPRLALAVDTAVSRFSAPSTRFELCLAHWFLATQAAARFEPWETILFTCCLAVAALTSALALLLVLLFLCCLRVIGICAANKPGWYPGLVQRVHAVCSRRVARQNGRHQSRRPTRGLVDSKHGRRDSLSDDDVTRGRGILLRGHGRGARALCSLSI